MVAAPMRISWSFAANRYLYSSPVQAGSISSGVSTLRVSRQMVSLCPKL
jgi:hypothetical protein